MTRLFLTLSAVSFVLAAPAQAAPKLPPWGTYNQASYNILVLPVVPNDGHLYGSRHRCKRDRSGWVCPFTIKLPDGAGRFAVSFHITRAAAIREIPSPSGARSTRRAP